ncbi:glycosyltransferase family 2 protein [Planctobacterium marinum]|uniref:Glycosyltransferase 2-like domain-containing protein n=1 Tax=Planctobacterium marinum TaxID=1631968 RepID=A0AA48HVM8_9ALTE|nr:hypothetical protein MACH26_09160 [Planctobacterium marinum]
MPQSKSGINVNFVRGLVSVIIPTHNRAELLKATLESIAKQSYRPIEIIVIDDDSQDHTRQLIEQFRQQEATSELTIHYQFQQYQNASLCRNEGLRSCTGEFIQFLDSDDVIHPDKLTEQVALLNSENLDFVWSATIQFTQQPDWHAPVYVGGHRGYANGEELLIAFINKSQWRTDSGLFRRSACVKTGLWSAITMFQDWDYHIRLLAWHPKVAHLNKKLSAARQHNQGRIGDKWGNGTGLDGALNALMNITEATQDGYRNNRDWQKAILSRTREIQQQSQKTGNHTIQIAAADFIAYFSSLNETLKEENTVESAI